MICRTLVLMICVVQMIAQPLLQAQESPKPAAEKDRSKTKPAVQDAKKVAIADDVEDDPIYAQYGIYQQTAPQPPAAEPRATTLPLKLAPGARIAFIGNTLMDRSRHYGHLETLLHQKFPKHRLVIRNLAWSADTIDVQPRPENFADLKQHLFHEKIDVIFAAFGFNESFAGDEGLEAFRAGLTKYVDMLKRSAFNGTSSPQVVLFSPIANENLPNIPAGDNNNVRLAKYTQAIQEVAKEQSVAFVDAYASTLTAMRNSEAAPLTVNGIHLNEKGYRLFAESVYLQLFQEKAPPLDESIRSIVVDQNRQYFRRYRPLNTFYYTGGRRKDYGYLDFLPAMRNFDMMVSNRDDAIWKMAEGNRGVSIDDSQIPPLPKTKSSRGANEWLSAAKELEAFKIDPRFEVNLFAGEEEFPDIAAPIQMRWDARGRLWVSCSTTYPHVYPGNEPNDKIVILEDTNGDGKADKSTVFADDLHIPLSFEFGDGGVYVSEMPDLTFLKDVDGDGKADIRQRLLTGFGTEDSHHALHDFVWTPDGDLIFRESIFHHSQVETPYGPVRQQNSGWFRFQPKTQRLTSFGTYPSTNPWGVTFDDWGQHMASHPIYAAAFHSLDPPYPSQHAAPKGLQAYSGTCGHEFVDFKTFPDEMMGDFIKVRYKPTNRVEILKWKEGEFGYEEEYVSDLLFSTNLSFIPVDLGYGPRGDLYVCDWYNPVKGHAQYSLRDERRDRHSGRIWRITTKGKKLQEPPKIAEASIEELLEHLKRPEYRIRYWAKRELRERNQDEVAKALDRWVKKLVPTDPRYRHHQLEALWTYRWIDQVRTTLLEELLHCEDHHARAAATQQLRYWHSHLPESIAMLRASANDSNGIVRMEAAIAATYIGTQSALDAMLDVLKHPRGGHLDYAIRSAVGSASLRRHWEGNANYKIQHLLDHAKSENALKEPTPTASEAQFDSQTDLKRVQISCLPERMRYTVEQFVVTTGQPVKLVFTNPDATDHNLLIVRPNALSEVGMAANEMARDPKNANSDFIPEEKRSLILHATPMIGPTRKGLVHVMRFQAPSEPGIYPYVCTFPGHWVIMKGQMVVAKQLSDVDALLAAAAPKIIKEWKVSDFSGMVVKKDEKTIMDGMQAFEKASCTQCHPMAGRGGANLGPDLSEVGKRFQGEKLLRQIIEPSSEIHEKFKTFKFLTASGAAVSGLIQKEDAESVEVLTNLLLPNSTVKIPKSEIELRSESRVSSMPVGLVNVLTKEEIESLVGFLESGGYKLPDHLRDKHPHLK